MEKQYNYLIAGIVQGVGMRYMISRKAQSLSLRGIVVNNADGTVQIRVAGTAAQIESFEKWLRSSPGQSSVEIIETLAVPDEHYPDFRIK